MALRGTLQDFSLADIFQLIGIQKKTGVLTLKNDKETCTVSFVDGSVVGADSTARRLEDRLGSVLVKSGRISEAHLKEALKIQGSTLNRLGSILVQSHFIDAKALSEALQVQISQMIYRLFRWTAGEYNFSQEEKVEYDRDLVSPMSAESILMEGARILDEWPMIERGIRSFSAVYRHADVEIARPGAASSHAGHEEAAGAVTLSATEQATYSLADGKRSVQEIVERSTLSEFETCRTLYDLISRQILEEVRGLPAARGAPAPAVRAAKPAQPSSLAAAVVTLFLVVLGGGALLYRVLPWISEVRTGAPLTVWLEPFLSPAQQQATSLSLGRGRLQNLDFSLQTYYLLSRGYPKDLHDLVTEGLLKPDALNDSTIPAVRYESNGTTYRLFLVSSP